MSFAEYSTALVEEVRRSTPANASCIISAEAAEEWLTHFWVAAAADEDDGRTAPPPIPYKLARVVVHGTGAAGAAGIAAHGGLRAAQMASRVAVRPRPRAAARIVCMTCGGRDPTCGCARAAGLFMKAASASRPLDHVYVAGSVDAAAFYTKAPKAERRYVVCLALANATDDVTVWSPQDGCVSRVEDVSGILPCYLVAPQETVQRAALGKGGALTYRRNGAAPVSYTTEAVAKAAAAALQEAAVDPLEIGRQTMVAARGKERRAARKEQREEEAAEERRQRGEDVAAEKAAAARFRSLDVSFLERHRKKVTAAANGGGKGAGGLMKPSHVKTAAAEAAAAKAALASLRVRLAQPLEAEVRLRASVFL